MKGKLTLTITIGFTAFIFTLVMFTQFKTIEQTDITAIETMREAELRSELAKVKEKYADVEEKLNETNSKINEYEEKMKNETDAGKLLETELNEAKKYLGYTDVSGQGIIITLDNGEFKTIESYDLISLVNELKLSGAEAISINDKRIVSKSEIVDIGDKFIMINEKRISSPYIIKAIGDQKYLESGITLKNGYIDEIKANDKKVEYKLEDEVFINAFDGKMEFRYSSVVE